MNIITPAQVAANRTARLVREARTPVYTSTRESEQRALIARAQELACDDDFCHICSRPTDHWGEHSDEQILAWAKRPGLLQRNYL